MHRSCFGLKSSRQSKLEHKIPTRYQQEMKGYNVASNNPVLGQVEGQETIVKTDEDNQHSPGYHLEEERSLI